MGLQGFAKAQKLHRIGHVPKRMGFDGDGSDVTRLAARVRVAKAFRGLVLEDIGEETILGYNALLQVFLTHSALERYLKLNKITMDGLEAVLLPYKPQAVVKSFFDLDKNGKLFQFLHERLDGRMPEKLTRCRDGTSANVGHISAAIRHIFVHGHLASRSYGVSPAKLQKACKILSDFLLRFMDIHFEERIDAYCAENGITL